MNSYFFCQRSNKRRRMVIRRHLTRVNLIRKKQMMHLLFLPVLRTLLCPETRCGAPSFLISAYHSMLSPGPGVHYMDNNVQQTPVKKMQSTQLPRKRRPPVFCPKHPNAC